MPGDAATYRADAGARPGRAHALYAVQAPLGREASCAARLSALLAASGGAALFPRYATEAKSRGRWVPVERALAPGYLIARCGGAEALEAAVSRVPGCRAVSRDGKPTPLPSAWAALLGMLDARGVLPMSRAVRLPDGSVCVTGGPLLGREASIGSVDRRRSACTLRLDAAGEAIRVKCGLAVLPTPAPEGAVA